MGKEIPTLMSFKKQKGKGDSKTGFNPAKLLSHIFGTQTAVCLNSTISASVYES